MSFEDWKEEQERIHNDYDAENAWYAGAQSRQAEIDGLRKRIDEALDMLEGREGKVLLGDIIDLLKGEQL